MKEINIEENESNIFGNITSLTEEASYIYLSAFFSEEELFKISDWLKTLGVEEFSLLRNVYVDEADRGKGVGKKLVTEFIRQSGRLPVLLLASPDEENFDLQGWYEKLGFQVTQFYSEGDPLMIKVV